MTRFIGILGALLIFFASPAAAIRDVAAVERSPVQARLLIDRDYFDALRDGIQDARAEIVVCAYLFKTLEGARGYPESIVKDLAAAVKRGVRVRVVMELSQESGDLVRTNSETARRLVDVGVTVCPDPRRKVTHAKLVVIDRRYLFVGSHNLTQSALKYNHETSLWIDSSSLAAEALDYLDSLCEKKTR